MDILAGRASWLRPAAQPLIIILGGDYFDLDGDPGAPSNRKYSTRGTPLVDYLNLSSLGV